MHQYTDKGSGSDYGASSASIDLNMFNGTKADFVKRYITPELTLEQRVAELESNVESLVQLILGSKGRINAVEDELAKLTKWAKGINYDPD
jgi:hypothetical protein